VQRGGLAGAGDDESFPREWKRLVKPSPSPEVAPIIKMVFTEEVISTKGGDIFLRRRRFLSKRKFVGEGCC
jgi:hypothetical protein